MALSRYSTHTHPFVNSDFEVIWRQKERFSLKPSARGLTARNEMQGRKNERLLLRGSEVKLADAMRIGIDARVLFGPHTGDRTYLLNLLRQFAAMDLPHEFLLFTDRVEPPSLGARGEGRVTRESFPANFRFVRLPKLSRWLYTGFLLPRACATYRVDLLHVQY
ncbi:MAG: hypothetical protein OGMRLDGQ_000086, partial [Candidatus Fervidibacter sp.]